MLSDCQFAELSDDCGPYLIVVVDTEEEFDWLGPPNPEADNVSAIERIFLVQEIFDRYGIVPCYVIDYPVASSSNAVAVLKEIADSGNCLIGAHLHPWVNPPIIEDLNRSNMFPGNLDAHLEQTKLELLVEKIQTSFELTPNIYKAGRYGFGPNTGDILARLGFEVDLSVCPAFNYGYDGGPSYVDYTSQPYWFGPDASILEIPVSSALVSPFPRIAKKVYEFSGHFDVFRARGILSRVGFADRLMLSPEAFTPVEHRKLVQYLLGNGVRTFTWSFHSPSVVPGITEYTRNERELREFLDSFSRFFDFFFGELGGLPTTPTALRNLLGQSR